MKRRNLFFSLAACPICALGARVSRAAEGPHWGYENDAAGPAHWGQLDPQSAVCGTGSQQSPINIESAIKASLPPLKIEWPASSGKIVNNGHTIQVDMTAGDLKVGNDAYKLAQFHFHAPSEHVIEGKSWPMEAHFVHRHAGGKGYGVVGIFIEAGAANSAFAKLADAMPKEAGKAASGEGIDPNKFLPKSLDYWRYAGSLTTPPCGEVVDWHVVVEPIQASADDIAKFTALYKMNARPLQKLDRRFVLRSS